MMRLDRKKASEKFKKAEETLFNKNVKTFEGHEGRLIRISSVYSGVWMEHAYDAVVLATLYPEHKDIALSQARIFLENQSDEGQFPALVRDRSAIIGNDAPVSYGQIQECVSFGSICFETYELTKDKKFLKDSYEAFKKWDNWLCNNRMTRNEGLIELFYEWDTGHDEALRLKGLPHKEGEGEPARWLAPDMNAVFYGDRIALSEMAKALGKNEESEMWIRKANEVKGKMFELLYDEEDKWFYDVDIDKSKRKYKTIMMANVFSEHVLDQELFDEIYNMYFKSEKHFDTYIPFPSTSVSDPLFIKNADGNSWNYYSQTLTALRTERWMPYYKKTKDYENLLYKWVCAFTESELSFGQEFDPLTGKPSKSSPDYSSALLFYIRAMRYLDLA